MALTQEMENYVQQVLPEAQAFLKELAVIPAPSHHEEKRVEFVKNWMEAQGARNVSVDGALNVIWPVLDDGQSELAVVMAHTDVVFPDTTPLPLRQEGNLLYCPGIGDDTLRLTLLLYAMKYFTDRGMKPNTNLMLVANSCEEGLGNLKGCRSIVDTYGSRIRELISVDGSGATLVSDAVGSHRYRVTVKTPGGHSWGAFGEKNAIACLASLITALYSVQVPKKEGCKTTYNVGTIEGGTSVNTIAQEASMLYEYRSADKECLAFMQNMFEKTVEAYRAMGIDITVEVLGIRPCRGDMREPAFTQLRQRIRGHILEMYGEEAHEHASSTDANYPLSLGIPAVTIGAGKSYKAHARQEYTDLEYMPQGLRYLLLILQDYFA